MPLGLTMHGKWDGISMASPQLHSYKHDRPAYSTPQPVENTPANNECRMVELRGAKVASFYVGGDEFICLPQAFDLFLKHLVGGLHTVYTKLKRLSIAPVVCNVEQVRILRGLGAIQPGVNRCKLITRKDFEILYQDCTQASRPGRPPKRYPMLPPTTDLMSHHGGMRPMNPTHGILSPAELSSLHKRMRFDTDAEKHLQQHQERRMSNSPSKDSPPMSDKDINSNDMHSNAAHLYLQAQQALRHQYQQVAASGLHNGLDAQHAAAAAAGINPALAPLMMMSHPALFSGALPPSSVAMLNHINQFAQSHSAGGNPVSNAAAAAVAQMAASGGSMHQQAAAAQAAAQVAAVAQSAAQASLAAAASAHNSSSRDDNRIRSNSVQDDKDSDCEEIHTPRSLSAINHVNSSGMTNGIGSDGCASPHSSISSTLIGGISDGSDNGYSMHSDSPNSNKDTTDGHETIRPSSHRCMARDCNDEVTRESNNNDADGDNDMDTMGHEEIDNENVYVSPSANSLSGTNISSMQTLLTNIQGLLKVAADNARLQEKHSSFEISDLKSRITKERQMRGNVEKKLHESERIRLSIQKRLKKERKMRKLLQEQLLGMQRQLGHDNDMSVSKIATAPTTPITGTHNSGRGSSISPSLSAINSTMTASSHLSYSSPSTSPSAIAVSTPPSASDVSLAPAYTKMPISSGSSPVSSASVASPTAVVGSFLNGRLVSTSSSTNSNNSSNIGSLSPSRGSQLSPFSSNRRSSIAEQEITLDLAIANRDHVDHLPIQDARLYFSNASRYQTTASQ